MSGPQRQQLADVETITPALTDKAVTIQAGKVKTSLYSAIYDLFKTGYDSVYTTASAVTLQISNALIGYATEDFADIAAAGAEAAANSYTDGVAATKQNIFDYSVTETGVNIVTINGVSGGVAEFTDVVAKNSFAVFKINSDLFLNKSKIVYSLNYNGNGYPVILSYRIVLGQVTFQVANISTTLDTNDSIIIEYQIVG